MVGSPDIIRRIASPRERRLERWSRPWLARTERHRGRLARSEGASSGSSDIHRRRRTRDCHPQGSRRPEPRTRRRSVGQATKLCLALGPDGRVPGTCHEPCYPARSMAYPRSGSRKRSFAEIARYSRFDGSLPGWGGICETPDRPREETPSGRPSHVCRMSVQTRLDLVF
jgi:hypothetical protein